MGSPFDLAHVDKIGSQAREYFFQHVLSWSMAAQIVVIGGALLLARKASGAMRAWLARQQEHYATHPEAFADLAVLLGFVKVIDAFLAFILVAIAYNIAGHFNWPRNELATPWRASVPIDYQVAVDVVRLDGRLGEAA